MAAKFSLQHSLFTQRMFVAVNLVKHFFFIERVTCLRVARFCFLAIIIIPVSVATADEAATSSKQKQTTEKAPVSLKNVEVIKTKANKTETPEIVTSKTLQKNEKIDKALIYIQSMAQTGALHLALSSLNQQQPSYVDDSLRWLIWERERISLLTLSNQNSVLVKRLDNIPKGINNSFVYWAKTQQATAYLNLKNYPKARQTLLSLIWDSKKTDSEFKNKWLPHWRRIIIHSYLGEGLIKDAYIAITRYRQDYGEGDLNDIILYARVLLMNNLNDEALTVLSKHTIHPDAGMLHLLAQLRKDVRSPRKVLQSALRQMQGDWVKPELKIYLWSIVAEAALRSEDRLAAIKAMEFIFSSTQRDNLPKGLFKLDIGYLWNAYIENAEKIGNKAQYLIGDDSVWLEAGQTFEATQAINARSLYAFLIIRGQDKSIKAQAVTFFLKSLSENDNGQELVSQLFLHSKQFKTKETIPVAVRHFLVDYALSQGDIRLASELMASIKTSPQGANEFIWGLRRARVLVMGGNAQESANTLIYLLDKNKEIPVEDIDKLIQVTFDLQTVNEHKKAFQVFEKMLPIVTDKQRRREIFYWMADSKKALEQYTESANLYLKSAMLPDYDHSESTIDISLDPWGQTARYQAAKSLAKAGLVSDARALYTHLLRVTKEESRIRVLKRELQQLWSLENKQP